jgi:DNA-binding MarR family transcriptional regulator
MAKSVTFTRAKIPAERERPARRSAADADPRAVSRAKWGDAIDAGFQVLPDALVKYQYALELTPIDLVVLINLTMHWWYADSLPFPTTVTIGKRMGASPRSVQRSLQRLESLGHIKRVRRPGQRTAFDLSPLATRLKKLARHDPKFGTRAQTQVGNVGVQTRGLASARQIAS